MFRVASFNSSAQVIRPDLEEYHLEVSKSGESYRVELWWDNQAGAKEGWCARLVSANGREQDIPVAGRRWGTSWKQLRRNVSAALNRWAVL